MDYKDLTVRQYYEILDVLENAEEAIDIQVGLIEAVYGVDAMNLSIQEFKEKSDSLSFLNKPYKAQKMRDAYMIGGMKFNTITDFSKVTTAQFIDYSQLLKSKNWKYIMNCLFIRDGESYGEHNYSELLYNSTPLSIYLDVLESFRKLFSRLQVTTLKSSIKEMKKRLKRETKEERVVTLRKIVEQKRLIQHMDD